MATLSGKALRDYAAAAEKERMELIAEGKITERGLFSQNTPRSLAVRGSQSVSALLARLRAKELKK